MEENKELLETPFRIVLIGDSGVGKTSLMSRYIKDICPQTPHPTIGVEFGTKEISLNSGIRVKAHIWDTGGQEKYRSIASAYYRRCNGALIVFDITKGNSFTNVPKWLKELKMNCNNPNIPILLVGNKLDIVTNNSHKRLVQYEDANSYAQENELIYTETSAKTAQNVVGAFQLLLEDVYLDQQKNRPDPAVNLLKSQKTTKFCCK